MCVFWIAISGSRSSFRIFLLEYSFSLKEYCSFVNNNGHVFNFLDYTLCRSRFEISLRKTVRRSVIDCFECNTMIECNTLVLSQIICMCFRYKWWRGRHANWISKSSFHSTKKRFLNLSCRFLWAFCAHSLRTRSDGAFGQISSLSTSHTTTMCHHFIYNSPYPWISTQACFGAIAISQDVWIKFSPNFVEIALLRVPPSNKYANTWQAIL